MDLVSRSTPENTRTSPTTSHYAEACRTRDEEVRLEREAAQRAPAPNFLAVYRHTDGLRHRGCIYALFDPRAPDLVMYVGQTTRTPVMRLDDHISDALRFLESRGRIRPCARTTWIASLLRVDVHPCLGVIEVVPSDQNIDGIEQYWIRFYRFRGQAAANGVVQKAGWYGLAKVTR